MPRRGIAMIEAVLATAIVGGLVVAALSLVGSVSVERRVTVERNTGQLLVQDLAEEIVALPVRAASPAIKAVEDRGLLKPLVGEVTRAVDAVAIGATANRSAYTAITDYDGLKESPPVDRNGSPIPGADGWIRTVEVTVVNSSKPEGDEDQSGSVVRVTVRAEINGRTVGELVLFRSGAADEVLQ